MGRNIIVVGQQKTGTTGVYSLIKSALAPVAGEFFFSFEPVRGRPLEEIRRRDPSRSIMTKIMYKNLDNFSLDMFNRRVMTVRDPRDTIVSTLLFKPMLKNVAGAVSMDQHERFIAGLRRKETDPAGVSIVSLMDLADEVGYRKHKPQRIAAEIVAMSRLAHEKDFHVVRYEDFVDNEVAGLAAYLGLPLNPRAAETSSWLTHISRSRAHGAWRDWFTEQDVEFYRPLMANAMKRIGYDDDWKLNESPEIDPSTSSSYVADRIVKRRRELATAQERPGDDLDSGTNIATLYSMASDGSARAALALARRLDGTSDFGGRWPVSALHWAREADLQGLAAAKRVRERLESEVAATSAQGA